MQSQPYVCHAALSVHTAVLAVAALDNATHIEHRHSHKLSILMGKVPKHMGKVSILMFTVPTHMGRVSILIGKVPYGSHKVPIGVGIVLLGIGKVPIIMGKVPQTGILVYLVH